MCESEGGERSEEWPWSLLGAPPAASLKEIRMAYAEALKKIDQRCDASQFQALREARDEAVARVAARAGGGADAGSAVSSPPPPPKMIAVAKEQSRDASTGAEEGAVFDSVFRPLTELLGNSQARASLAGWARMLEERPLMSDRQAYAFERCVVLTLDSWLDSENLPSHEVFLVLDNTFGWSAAGSNLSEFLPRLRERRLRTIISSLRA